MTANLPQLDSTPESTSNAALGQPRPMTRVILLSVATGLLYYGYYKWTIQDELKAHGQKVWSGAVCIIPFVLGIALPLLLAAFDPDVPSDFAKFSFLGVLWIYIVQYRLYKEINRLYVEQGWKAPLVSWWIIVPGLNLIVGLRQIHFLSEYWARLTKTPTPDPVAEKIPFLSSNG
ncbi:MAG: hypothetical protein AAF810_19160 [Cyanobacteria bacterium P01_D01_bin.36]